MLFEASGDGEHFKEIARIANSVDERDMEVKVWDCEARVKVNARYLRVSATNIGTIPQWHPGAGYPGFIFIDEIWAE